jgi:DNA polymerase III psi subunit
MPNFPDPDLQVLRRLDELDERFTECVVDLRRTIQVLADTVRQLRVDQIRPAAPTTRLHSYKVGKAEPIEDWGKGHTLVSPDAANAEAQPVPADSPVERVAPEPQGPND